MYQQFWLLRVLKPAWSYRLNADMFHQIGCDEGVHKEISLARMVIPAARA